jgi:large subunit ribosomal protein L24
LQTTLLTLAVALILALVAALVGPFFIDWGAYRSVFEKEASRLAGLDIRVKGDIEAKLLPSPRLTMYGVEIGDGAARAGSVSLEFALGPLMRGEWHASDVQIASPQVHIAIDKSGAMTGPAFAFHFDPDALSIERLGITDGTVVVSDASSGKMLEADKVWFNGSLSSLLGPIKGEGAATVGGALYPFRLSTGRVSGDGAMRLHLNVDPVSTPLAVEADGTLSAKAAKPQFQGTWSLSRPAGLATRPASGPVTQPWKLGGKLKLTPASALMEQVGFQYGSDASALKLSGTAELKFGAQPRFDGVLSAQQIDFDRLAGEDEAQHAPPAVTLRRLVSLAGQAFKPAIPIRIGLGIDTVTLGGADVQNVRGDISTASGGWTLDRFEFRAPGFTDVRLSGRLEFENSGAVFRGPAEIKAINPNTLAAWLEGRKNAPKTPPRPLRVRGDVTLSNEKIAIERLAANFDRGAVSGRFIYTFGSGKTGGSVDASLSAPELDLDAANAFIKAVSAGSTVERPSTVSLALDIGRASFAGYEAGKTVAQLQYGDNGLDIERLTVDNFGGANIDAKGRIALAPSPHGNLALDLDARDLGGVNTLLARFVPGLADRLRSALPSLAPAKLHASLSIANPSNTATVAVDGTAGVVRVAFNGTANGDPKAPADAAIKIDGRLDADDGSMLASLFGVGKTLTVGKKPGSVVFKAAGPALGEWHVDGAVTAGGLDAKANGTAEVAPGHDPKLALKVTLGQAALTLPSSTALASGRADIALDGDTLDLTGIDGAIAGTQVRGHLAVKLAEHRVSGAIDAGTIDLVSLMALAVGFPPMPAAADGAWTWSTDAFDDGALPAYRGTVDVTARRAGLTPALAARDFRAAVRFGGDELALDKMSGAIAGGAFSGGVTFTRAPDGITAGGKLTIDKADVAALLPPAARPPITGRLGLMLSAEGSGRSPVALIGSLHGNGTVSLADGQLAGLDPHAFAAIVHAVDNGLAIEAPKIEPLMSHALESGQLQVKAAESTLSVSAGQIRLDKVQAKGDGADVSAEGVLDLTNGRIDARLVLTGADTAAGTRPDVYVALRGPITSPDKTVDVSALTGWLTLRAVDRESKRLEEAEAKRRALEAAKAAEVPPLPSALPVVPVKPEPAPTAAPPPAAPHTAAPKQKRAQTPKKPAPAHRTERAPALPAPINILPPPGPPRGGASVNP